METIPQPCRCPNGLEGPAEARLAAETEAAETGAAQVGPESAPLTVPTAPLIRITSKTAYAVQQLVLGVLEQEVGNVERNVRFRKGSTAIVFDGLVRQPSGVDLIIEVKVALSPWGVERLAQAGAAQVLAGKTQYELVTGRQCQPWLIVVSGSPLTAVAQEKLELLVSSIGREIVLRNFDLQSLGFLDDLMGDLVAGISPGMQSN